MTRSCLSAFDSREADDPLSMAPGFYAFPHEDYDGAPVGPFPTYVEAVTAARAEEGRLATLAAELSQVRCADVFAIERAHRRVCADDGAMSAYAFNRVVDALIAIDPRERLAGRAYASAVSAGVVFA